MEDQAYKVFITTINGCVEKAEILFKVDRDINIYAPNVFSPHNKDGINDGFFLQSAENTISEISSFRIFDRWGNQVHEAKNVPPIESSHAWYGEFKGKKASLGVYVWQAEVILITGQLLQLKGDVTLVK